MTNPEQIKKHLFSLNNRGIKYDLHRITDAAAECDNPQNSYKAFHIAGTNGKGSTSTYIAAALRACGFSTGLYTSPHILFFEERFLVNGKPAGEEMWVDIYLQQQQIIEQYNLTFFEATTLMAFELFKRSNVDWAVFETGLGGRLDATNIIIPDVSVITGIAMDHTDYLGKTLDAIAMEKLGIVKENKPLVFSGNSDPSINALAAKICKEKNASLHLIQSSDAEIIKNGIDGLSFTWNGNEYQLKLPGSFQLTNALLALTALNIAGINRPDQIREGLENAFLPGRFQIVKYLGKTIVFDVGHNPDAASALVSNLKTFFGNQSICFVTGIMKDKDTAGVLQNYCTIAKRIIVAKPETDRAASAEQLSDQARQTFGFENIDIAQSVGNAVQQALSGNEDVICISGSFYTVGEAFQELGIGVFDVEKR